MVRFICLFFVSISILSCLSTKDVRYFQDISPDDKNLVSYNMEDYKVTKNDMFNLNIITTSKGDAAQFYSRYNAPGDQISAGSRMATGGRISRGNTVQGAESSSFYFDGIKVNENGDIYIIGVGYIKAEGRTVAAISAEIQNRVDENFLKGKSEVRLNIDGIHYYLLGDIETVGVTGEKISYTQSLNIMEAIAKNGGLNRTVDRSKVMLQRRYPEGVKTVYLNLTKKDLMNSKYYWIQNGDIIYLNTRPKSFYGFGQDPRSSLIAVSSTITTLVTLLLLFRRR
ncbi:MAG: gliding motility protein [Bergeyella sp.]|nr:gliding motility protein [Bergeyella sp.]